MGNWGDTNTTCVSCGERYFYAPLEWGHSKYCRKCYDTLFCRICADCGMAFERFNKSGDAIDTVFCLSCSRKHPEEWLKYNPNRTICRICNKEYRGGSFTMWEVGNNKWCDSCYLNYEKDTREHLASDYHRKYGIYV
jgi:hypothetical protein